VRTYVLCSSRCISRTVPGAESAIRRSLRWPEQLVSTSRGGSGRSRCCTSCPVRTRSSGRAGSANVWRRCVAGILAADLRTARSVIDRWKSYSSIRREAGAAVGHAGSRAAAPRRRPRAGASMSLFGTTRPAEMAADLASRFVPDWLAAAPWSAGAMTDVPVTSTCGYDESCSRPQSSTQRSSRQRTNVTGNRAQRPRSRVVMRSDYQFV
jgi:hypothetical protein